MYNAIKHFETLYQNAPREFAFSAASQFELQSWQAAFRPRLHQILGLENLKNDLAGHTTYAEQRDTKDKGNYIQETWHLWVEPTVPLPFYLLRPKYTPSPLPLMLTPHGHHPPHLYAGIVHTKEDAASIREFDRDIALQAVNAGYLTIAPTARGFGETRTENAKANDELHACRIELMHGLLVGRTPLGERVWDISRLIDWALANLDVDPHRVAVTGNSGGGATTLFAAACDPRITVAVPSSYFCTFAASIGSIWHCACNYVPGMLRLGEMYDVAGLIAPRPFLAINGEHDDIFPIDAARFAFEKLQQVYAVAGVPQDCQHYIGAGGHRYYKAAAWSFINHYLQQGSQNG
ncbi:MAG: acetylxylan esterase [Anaerolineales bacterium]|nr:acetylxylan esterase [Anaerolineales bacterium]